MKLVFGDHKCLTPEMYDGSWAIFNLNSLKEGFERLNIILPFNMISGDEVYSKEYDIIYANYLINDNNAFMEYMKVIMCLYMGNNVYILSDKNGIYEYICESLQKFIQSRYGLISYIVNELEDWDLVNESSFNIYGVANLDKDKDRFTYAYVSMNPSVLKL